MVENTSSGTGKMTIAVITVVIICSAGFIYIIANPSILSDFSDLLDGTDDDRIQGIHSPLKIVGDQEMIDAVDEFGFSGSGTETDPYIIENLSIVSEGNCIDIRHVQLSFEIRNCSVGIYSWYISAIGIYLRNCTAASIIDCHAEGGLSGIEFFLSDGCTVSGCLVKDTIFGINATESHESTIIDNAVLNTPWGINTGVCNSSEISSNLLYNNTFGIRSYASFFGIMNANNISECSTGIDVGTTGGNWTITSNYIVNSIEYGIKLGELTNGMLIYNNRLGWNGISSALDDGFDNKWDLGQEYGNYWHDYNGTGWYAIDGTAESFDRCPSVFE